MSKVEPKWYVIRTTTNKEKQVKELVQLELERINLKNFELLLPIEKVYVVKNSKKYLREKNFYPGYLFVKTNAVGEVEEAIKDIKFSYGFLRDGRNNSGRPQPLRQSEIEQMVGKVDEVADKTNTQFEYLVGESVNIIDGPFNSFTGEVREIDGEKQRLKLNVKIFGRDTALDLKFEQVQKVY